MRRGGFVLPEVVVALVVLSVAGAATVALVSDALRTIANVELEAAILRRTAEVADSLVRAGTSSGGRLDAAWGRIEWTAVADGLEVHGISKVSRSRYGTEDRTVVTLEVAP